MDTHVTPGNVHDSQQFIGRLKRQIDCFGLEPVAVGVDAGYCYFTASVCHLTQEMDTKSLRSYELNRRSWWKNIAIASCGG